MNEVTKIDTSKAYLPSVPLPEIELREAQTATLRQFYSEFKEYQKTVDPELRRLSSRFNEFLNYVRVDLKVPEGYGVNQELTKFVPIPQQATAEPIVAEPLCFWCNSVAELKDIEFHGAIHKLCGQCITDLQNNVKVVETVVNGMEG